MNLSTELSILALLISSVVMLWFTTLAVIKTGRKIPFLPFFFHFSLTCFIAAGLFTEFDFSLLSYFVSALSLIIGVLFLMILRRERYG
jgi:hypothetical protein